jgi:hypothetical protein
MLATTVYHKSIWKQLRAISANVASLIGRIIIADHSDLFGGLETDSILPLAE